jgi:flagellar biosynthesis/type III secretory pathway protein FliH
MTRPQPFRFDEFRPEAHAPVVKTCSIEEVEAARLEGAAEGRRLAMESIAADEAAQLERIGDALAAQIKSRNDALASAREDLLTVARIFLEEFAGDIAERREIEAGEDLLRRLTEHSEDRRAARLIISAKSLPRLRDRLQDIIGRRGLGDFVTLEGDPGLQRGEVRIEWRGGRLERGRAEINAAVAAIFDNPMINQTETPDERA